MSTVFLVLTHFRRRRPRGRAALDDLLEIVAEERQALEAVTGIMRVMRHERL